MERLVKIIILAVVATACLAPSVSAWGPKRTTYTVDNPSTVPALNSITDNELLGDERDFVRIVEKDSNNFYSDYVEVEAGKDYEVFIYINNDADFPLNLAKNNYSGVARDVRLSTKFPTSLESGEEGAVSGTLTADNTAVEKIWDEAYVKAMEDVELRYLEGSAKIHNDWAMDGSVLSLDLFGESGTLVGLDLLNGIILGGTEHASYVTYTLRAVEPTNTFISSGIFNILIIVLILLILALIVFFIILIKRRRDEDKEAEEKTIN